MCVFSLLAQIVNLSCESSWLFKQVHFCSINITHNYLLASLFPQVYSRKHKMSITFRRHWLRVCVLQGKSCTEVKHILSIGLGSCTFAPLFTAWWLFLQEGLLEVVELTCLYKSDDIVGVDSYLQPTGAGVWRVLWKQSCHRKADENRRGPSVTKQTLLKKVRAFTCNSLCACPFCTQQILLLAFIHEENTLFIFAHL